MKPAASYLRCSTDGQDESIPAQREQIERFAEERDFEVVEEFAEEGLSGTSTDRPQLQKLIAASENGSPWDTIFCWDRSRLGRPEDPIDLLSITSRITKAGKKIIPLHGAQTTGDKMVDSIIELVEFAQAGQESVRKSRDVLRGQHKVAARGSRNGGRIPYGYDALYLRDGKHVRRVRYLPGRKLQMSLDGRKQIDTLGRGSVRMQGESLSLVPGDPRRVRTVELIFRRFVNGRSVRSIVRDLNQDGVEAPRGGTWGRTTITSILRNPAYRGRFVWNRHTGAKFYRVISGGEIVRVGNHEQKRLQRNVKDHWIVTEDAWEPLVNPELWEAAQARLRAAHETPGALRGRGAKSPFLASGLLHCTCKQRWTGCSYPSKRDRSKRFAYYRCEGRGKAASACHSQSIRRDVIDGYLEQRIRELYHRPTMQTALWEEIVAELDIALDSVVGVEAPKPTGKSVEIEKRIDRLVAAVENGVLEPGEAKVRLEIARAEKCRLQRTDKGSKPHCLSVAERRRVRDMILKTVRARLRQEAKLWDGASLAGRKRVVRGHVQRIDVDPAANRATVAFYPLLAGVQDKSLRRCARRPPRP